MGHCGPRMRGSHYAHRTKLLCVLQMPEVSRVQILYVYVQNVCVKEKEFARANPRASKKTQIKCQKHLYIHTHLD